MHRTGPTRTWAQASFQMRRGRWTRAALLDDPLYAVVATRSWVGAVEVEAVSRVGWGWAVRDDGGFEWQRVCHLSLQVTFRSGYSSYVAVILNRDQKTLAQWTSRLGHRAPNRMSNMVLSCTAALAQTFARAVSGIRISQSHRVDRYLYMLPPLS